MRHGRLIHLDEGLLHLVVALPVAIEETHVQPGFSLALRDFDHLSILTFGGAEILVLFRDACINPVLQRAAQLDPHDADALVDVAEYYLEAPGIMASASCGSSCAARWNSSRVFPARPAALQI